MAKEMTVLKRNGDPESVLFDEILVRLKSLGGDLNINYTNLVIKTVNQLYDNISTSKIDELVAELCASMATEHLDYNILAGKIVISNNHKDTESDYKKIVSSLYFFSDTTHKERAPLVSEKFYTIVHENSEKIQKMIDYSRDYLIDYFGWKTLARAYLLKLKGKIVERPQHMWMRVALSIHGNDMPLVQETYDFLSLKFFTHAGRRPGNQEPFENRPCGENVLPVTAGASRRHTRRGGRCARPASSGGDHMETGVGGGLAYSSHVHGRVQWWLS